MMFISLMIAALLPSVILLIIIYKEDKIEKESPRLLFRLLLCGVAAALAAMFVEPLMDKLLGIFLDTESTAYIVLSAFLCIAAVEEGFKLLFCKLATWRNPEFNFRFDGVVYMVFTSLGFAGLENILYAFSYGSGVLFSRALFSIPAHMGFAVFMGTFYGTARIYDAYGDHAKAQFLIFLGYIVAVLLHGFYDACLSLDNTLTTVIFYIFVIIMDILVICQIRKDSKNDRLIHY